MAATAMLNEEDTFIVCLDVEGAFDRVWHQALLHKMQSFGFPDIALAWMASFLDGRTFRVRIGNSHSTSRQIAGGVPQGSPLSPILYVLFTADLVRELPREIRDRKLVQAVTDGLFADDIALAKSGKVEKEVVEILNRALDAVALWFRKWRLKINALKSQAIRISTKYNPPTCQLAINGVIINWFEQVKYLGVWFDRFLNWNHHLSVAMSKSRSRMSALQGVSRRRFGLTPKAAVIVYNTYIRPVLTYGCQAWLGIPDHRWEALETTQRIALRIALRLPSRQSNDDVYNLSGSETLRTVTGHLAVEWLDRALNSGNLVGQEVLPILDRQEVDERPYRALRIPPLGAMAKFAMTTPARVR